jgi:hypothetical protein
LGVPILGDIIEDVIGSVGDLISEVVVDKDKRNEINLELEKIKDAASARISDERIAQIEVNKEEAKSGSIFVAGWRPFVGWVSGAGLAAQAILLPIIESVTGRAYTLDTTLLIFTLGGMLGIGGMRTFEKVRGVSTNDYTDRPRGAPENILPPVYAALPEDAPWTK